MKELPADGNSLHSLENEMAVIGSCFFGAKPIKAVRLIVQPEMFLYEGNRLLFRAICALNDRNAAVDVLTVESFLKEHGLYEEVGERAYIMRCAEVVPSPANAKFYADNVRTLWIRRKLEEAAQDLLTNVRDPDAGTAIEVGQKAKDSISRALTSDVRAGYRIGDLDLSKPKETIPSCFNILNSFAEHRGALIKGQLSVYGASTGVGKSTALMQECLHLVQLGKRGIYYTFSDLDQNDIARRMMRQMTGYPEPPSNMDQRQEWDAAWEELKDPFLGLTILTGSDHGRDLDSVCNGIAAHHAEEPLDFFVIDYFQKIKFKSKKYISRFEQLETISLELGNLASDTKTAGLVAAQITVGTNTTIIRGGDDLKNDSGLCLFISRTDNEDYLEVHVEKMRFGRSAWTFGVERDPARLRYKEQGEIKKT